MHGNHRFASRLVPMLESSAVMQVPMLAPSTSRCDLIGNGRAGCGGGKGHCLNNGYGGGRRLNNAGKSTVDTRKASMGLVKAVSMLWKAGPV